DGKAIESDMMHIIRRCLDKDPTQRPSTTELKSLLTESQRLSAILFPTAPSGVKIAVGVSTILLITCAIVLVCGLMNGWMPDWQSKEGHREYRFAGVDAGDSLEGHLQMNPVPVTSSRDVSLLVKASKCKDPYQRIHFYTEFIAGNPVASGRLDPDVLE